MNSKKKYISIIAMVPLLLSLIFATCDEEGNIINPPVLPDTTGDAIRLFSTDDGISWGTEIIQGANGFNSIVTQDSVCYLTGSGLGNGLDMGLLLTGKIGGIHWENGFTKPDANMFRSACVLNGTHTIALCTDALDENLLGVYLTTDNGTIWRKTQQIVGLLQLTFIDALEGITVGASGRILRSSDGGLTWQIIPSPLSGDLHDVDFIASIGFACGRDGHIIRSSDRGVSWGELFSVPTQQTLRSIKMIDNNTVITVGDNGTILRSSDSGLNWNIIETLGNIDYKDVEYNYAESTMIAVGSSGRIMRSTNLGGIWASNTELTERTLNAIHVDSRGGWHIVGE